MSTALQEDITATLEEEREMTKRAFAAGGSPQQSGMSLRDYFAAKAMQALLTNNQSCYTPDEASFAYSIAELMMEARKQKGDDDEPGSRALDHQ